jgi:hypothetical protein
VRSGTGCCGKLNSKNVLDGVTVTVKVAVEELGARTVACELRRIAKHLEKTGNVPGWRFPKRTRAESVPNPEIQKKSQEASQNLNCAGKPFSSGS